MPLPVLSRYSVASCQRAGFLLLPLVYLITVNCGNTPPAKGVEKASIMPSSAAQSGPFADDGQWTMPAKDFANTRFSGLDQVNRATVKNLHVAWTFSTGTNRGNEGQPLVVGDTLYYVSPFPNILYAVDVRDGSKRWAYYPKPVDGAKGVACCDHVNRGAFFDGGRIYYNTLDNHMVAVDAANGRELWKTTLGDINMGETMTMAPIVVKGKVLAGNSGGEYGVRGWITAVDAGTGRIAWRAYNTGPDKDVLIGPNFKPFYPMDQGQDLGVKTWPPDHWKIGGATVWGWISYDPSLDLIYHGTSNPGAWNPDLRPGDNKWSAAILARRPETGEAVWGYQFMPHDVFDYDAINESVLVDLTVNGKPRKTLLRAEKNGFFYVMDRGTGEVLRADNYMPSTSTHGVDLKTGRPQEDGTRKPGFGGVARNICPAVPGAKNWNPMAYSRKTGLAYIPGINICMDMEGVEANYIAGTPYLGTKVVMYPGPGGHRGEMIGWDPVAGAKRWGIREKFPVYSGVLATAGDVVFYGTMDRWFKAVDAHSGQELWKFRTGSGIISSPIAFRGPDGKQYIAVVDGVGGWPGSIVSAGLSASDAYAADGMVNAMKDLPAVTPPGGTIYVFALP